ncbi:MAG: hypothetical protein R3E95_08775 [Thiolinea sp.]
MSQNTGVIPRPLSTLLTYSAETTVPTGCRVSVPLGRGRSIGLVMATAEPATTR